jgi:hypothetical protein
MQVYFSTMKRQSNIENIGLYGDEILRNIANLLLRTRIATVFDLWHAETLLRFSRSRVGLRMRSFQSRLLEQSGSSS